jgi:hypothetical protein
MSDHVPVYDHRIGKLPRDKHGRPVPWFVAFIDGVPDFRVIRRRGIQDALRLKLCWVCGEPMGAWSAFVIGPMCAVNRTSAEPPSHRDCGIYSATHCPFLVTPSMQRRERGIPEDRVEPAGIMLKRNPGVALVWITRKWSTFRAPDGGILFDIGEPAQVEWFAEGRLATGEEVRMSIGSGLPILRGMAEEDGPKAVDALEAMTARAMTLVPA